MTRKSRRRASASASSSAGYIGIENVVPGTRCRTRRRGDEIHPRRRGDLDVFQRSLMLAAAVCVLHPVFDVVRPRKHENTMTGVRRFRGSSTGAAQPRAKYAPPAASRSRANASHAPRAARAARSGCDSTREADEDGDQDRERHPREEPVLGARGRSIAPEADIDFPFIYAHSSVARSGGYQTERRRGVSRRVLEPQEVEGLGLPRSRQWCRRRATAGYLRPVSPCRERSLEHPAPFVLRQRPPRVTLPDGNERRVASGRLSGGWMATRRSFPAASHTACCS